METADAAGAAVNAAGLVPGYVRMSIGIEDVEDLWADLERGFANV